MSAIRCHKLTKRFEGRNVLDGIEWTIADGDTVALLGGSGAGKTTLLRLMAGLTRPTSGDVLIGEANRRPRIGMVFQNLALWPHLTVRQHLECVLSQLPTRRRGVRAEELLTECRQPPAVWRQRPTQLSGGEAQRLALARALAVEPDVLLLDEPLTHLDPPLRIELLQVIRDCLGARRVTCVFVTHSWDEAIQVCSHVAVLDGGRLAQEGTPDELYWGPANCGVARWTGPVVGLSRSWLTDAVCLESTTLEQIVFDGETALVRPQQLSVLPATDQSCWRVVDARPQGGGWWTTLASTHGQFSLPLPQRCQKGAPVSLRLHSASETSRGGQKNRLAEH